MATAKYPQNGISSDGVLDTANTNTDGTTGSYTTLHTGSSGGDDEIEVIYIQAAGTTTAGMLRFWVHDGTTAVCVAQVPVPPQTPVYTFPQIPLWSAVVRFDPPIRLPSTSHTFKGSTHVSETFRVLVQGKDYV